MRQYLTHAQNHKILERTKLILRELKDGTTEQKIEFSDEKLFIIEATVNNQNARVYAKSLADIDDSVRTVFRGHKPCFFIEWIAVSKYIKLPLIFVQQGVKINTDR